MSVVVKGKVTVKVQGVMKQKQLSGNWAVLCDGGGKNDQPPCITLYDANDQATPLHTIILEHLKFPDKSYQHQEPFLVVSIKKDKHHFHFEDAASKEEWVHSFCHVSTDLWKQWASAKESSETESDSFGDMSDNMLYDSFSAAPTFKVSVNPSPASERNNVKGHYLLSPTKDSLKLLEIDTSKCLFEWSYKQIRKYGKTSTLFKMEVGRSCPTGPGEFVFFTPVGLALSEVIAMQTRQTFNQSYKPPQEQAASSAPAENTDHAERQTSDPVTSDSSAQQPPPAAAPPQRRENQTAAGSEARRSQANSTTSVESRRETPKPAPRTSINKAKQERSSMNGRREAPSSSSSSTSDTKIYATPSGLTAPLDSPLKQELQNKVHSQLSHTSQTSQIEDDPASDNARNSISSHGSSESLKDKRKSDKERKKLEKEQKAAEAKRKKQLEKEQKEREKELKEQRERETKEEKERQKKLKKESKSREKLKSKKSIETPVSEPEPCADGNIYDEPGELLKGQQPTALEPVDSHYCEAGDVIPALQKPSSTEAAAVVSDVYAIPCKPKDSWRTHARPESDHVHHENYDAIKQACQSQPNSRRSTYSPPSDTLPGVEDVDDTYSHLRDFKPLTPAPENIYGMASAKDTVAPHRPAAAVPSVVENEYEEASAVSTSLSSKQEAAEVKDDHGKTDAPRRTTINIRGALDDDYADVSDS